MLNNLMDTLRPLLSNLSDSIDRACEAGQADSCRIFHGRGRTFRGLEQVTLDAFGGVLLLTLFAEHDVIFEKTLIESIHEAMQGKFVTLVVQRRYEQGAPSEIFGEPLPDSVYAMRSGLKFHLHLAQQQNTGFFLDMEPGRQWLESHAHGKKVLNLFSYTCAFSVVAVAAGAEKVVNVDMSRAALNLGRANHQLNGLDAKCSEYLAEDILKSWGRIKRRGPYDIVILDPPSFQKGSFIAEKDYVKLVRRLPELLPQGGQVLACLNAPELSVDFLLAQFGEVCPAARLVTRLEPSPDFPDIDANRQLKLLVFELPASSKQTEDE